MAARVSKEEQTQRVMIALNETKPSYPGRTDEEIGTLLDKVSAMRRRKITGLRMGSRKKWNNVGRGGEVDDGK